jgi:hypothetical protein
MVLTQVMILLLPLQTAISAGRVTTVQKQSPLKVLSLYLAQRVPIMIIQMEQQKLTVYRVKLARFALTMAKGLLKRVLYARVATLA